MLLQVLPLLMRAAFHYTTAAAAAAPIYTYAAPTYHTALHFGPPFVRAAEGIKCEDLYGYFNITFHPLCQSESRLFCLII